ncbi:MAG TPA: ATP-binding protein [Anaerolineaceae bacterium]|nr:ATP-binding protein [Anaerolineaceae bacterium]
MDTTQKTPRVSLGRFLGGVVLAFAVGLGLFYWLMSPPMEALAFMVELMAITSILSVAAAYVAYRSGWINRTPSLRLSLMGGYALVGLVMFINIGSIAWLMFASQHDLLLATVLLVFATGIAMSLGFFLSQALTDRIRVLDATARSIAGGELGARVPVNGRDEMAKLGMSFNTMADQLEAAQRKQKELDTLRRELIAWVGHDLRTPLTSIRAILEALADGLVTEPQMVQRYLNTAQQDVRALSGLIDDLFELSQIDAGGLRLDLHANAISDLISDTIERFSALAAEQGVALEGQVAPGTDPVILDGQRIGRVLYNLVANGLRHTPRGGKIEIHARRENGSCVVEVSDSGEGIQPEDLPHLFDQFYRGEKSRNRATGGAGLGLAISRGIVDAHGGTIGVESQPGQGARFWFTLPGRFEIR